MLMFNGWWNGRIQWCPVLTIIRACSSSPHDTVTYLVYHACYNEWILQDVLSQISLETDSWNAKNQITWWNKTLDSVTCTVTCKTLRVKSISKGTGFQLVYAWQYQLILVITQAQLHIPGQGETVILIKPSLTLTLQCMEIRFGEWRHPGCSVLNADRIQPVWCKKSCNAESSLSTCA